MKNYLLLSSRGVFRKLYKKINFSREKVAKLQNLYQNVLLQKFKNFSQNLLLLCVNYI